MGALYCALAVMLGAFAAHSLKDQWEPSRLATVETAARYLMYAGLGLQFAPQRLLAIGGAVFSGSLVLLAFTQVRWLGAITPLGGLAMIVGWLWAAKNFHSRAA